MSAFGLWSNYKTFSFSYISKKKPNLFGDKPCYPMNMLSRKRYDVDSWRMGTCWDWTMGFCLSWWVGPSRLGWRKTDGSCHLLIKHGDVKGRCRERGCKTTKMSVWAVYRINQFDWVIITQDWDEGRPGALQNGNVCVPILAVSNFVSFHFNLEDFSPKVQQIHVVEPTSRGPWTDGIYSKSHPLPIEIHVGHVGPCRAMWGHDRWVRDVIDIPPQIEPRTWPQLETIETVPTAFQPTKNVEIRIQKFRMLFRK